MVKMDQARKLKAQGDQLIYHVDDIDPGPDYPSQLIKIFGCIQVGLGLFCIATQSAGIMYDAHLSYLGTGIWTGIFFVVSGGIQLGSANRSVCLIISSMVLCVVSAIVTSLVVLSAAFGLHFDTFASYYFAYNKEVEGKLAVNLSLICVAVLEATISIWSSALCCRAVCCKSTKPQHKIQ